MTMTNYYLKTDSETALFTALEGLGLAKKSSVETPEGQAVEYYELTPGIYLDTIGTIYDDTGKKDAEGIPIKVAMPGYHANLLANITQAVADKLPKIPAPKTPYRVWA